METKCKKTEAISDVYVVLDQGLIYRTKQTIVRDESGAQVVKQSVTNKQDDDHLKCYSEYKVKGEFLYTRPFLEEYLRSLL
jgi:hypothetical protein